MPPTSSELGIPPWMHITAPTLSFTLAMSEAWNIPTVLPAGRSAR